jgi:hypothetical protein
LAPAGYSEGVRRDQHAVENRCFGVLAAFWRGIDSVRRALDCGEQFEGVYRKPLDFCRWRLT